MLEPFLVGVISMGSMTASVFFLKFYSPDARLAVSCFRRGVWHRGAKSSGNSRLWRFS